MNLHHMKLWLLGQLCGKDFAKKSYLTPHVRAVEGGEGADNDTGATKLPRVAIKKLKLVYSAVKTRRILEK